MIGNCQTKFRGNWGTQRGNRSSVKTLALRALANRAQPIRSLISVASQDEGNTCQCPESSKSGESKGTLPQIKLGSQRAITLGKGKIRQILNCNSTPGDWREGCFCLEKTERKKEWLGHRGYRPLRSVASLGRSVQYGFEWYPSTGNFKLWNSFKIFLGEWYLHTS